MTKKINSVLLIDDDIMSNMNSKRIIEKTDAAIEIHLAESGFEALELFETKFIPEGKFPDIIFLDIYMPRFSGWQFLEFYKGMTNRGKTKVILLSSSEEDADRERARKIPEVSGYKIKPLTEEYIHELTQNIPLTNE